MKKLIILPLAFLLLPLLNQAQNGLFKAGVVGLGYSEFDNSFLGPMIGFEAPLGRLFSLNINGAYATHKTLKSNSAELITRDWHFEPEVRFYLKRDITGFFIGANMSYSKFDYKIKSGNPSNFAVLDIDSLFGFGVSIGFQGNLNNKLTLGTRATLGATAENGEYRAGLEATIGFRL